MKKIFRAFNLEITLIASIAAMAFIKLDTVPPAWFDEGWTLSLARNWVVLGHYGHLYLGKPVQTTILNAGFPVIGPVALSFYLFGIGIWQSRLPGVLLTLGALVLLYDLVRKLWGRDIALWTWFVVLALAAHPDMHPVIMGRMVMGEMYVVFYLILGFWALWKSWDQTTFLILGMVGWGAALQAKPQTAPFLFLSLTIPGSMAFLQSNKRVSFRLISGLAGALCVSWIIRHFEVMFLNGGNDPYHILNNMKVLFTYVLALNFRARLYAIVSLLVLLMGLPSLIGLIYVAARWVMIRVKLPRLQHRNAVLKVCLWVLGASWYYWYIGFSMGWARYVFPAIILSSCFAAKWIDDLTRGLSLPALLKEGATILTRPLRIRALGITFLILTLPITYVLTFTRITEIYTSKPNGFFEVVWFINHDSTPTAIVETYESELYFLLEKPYHYPPDDVQHTLNQRLFFNASDLIMYDPLQENNNIDYLVIGFMSRFWGLDKIILQNPSWHLILNAGLYQVYVRIP